VVNVEYFNYLDSVIINNTRCTSEVKSRIVVVKVAFKRKKNLFTFKLDLNLGEKLVTCYIGALHFMGLRLGHFGE
jgi:hypothetical protein